MIPPGVLSQGGTPPFTPLDLTPAGWYDPSNAAARVLEGGNLVERLIDLSGNGRDLYQSFAGTGARPDFLTNQWAAGAFATPNTEGLLYQGPALSLAEYTVFMVGYVGTDNQAFRGLIPLNNGDVSAGATSRCMLYVYSANSEFQICNGNSPSFKYAETLAAPGTVPIGKHVFTWKQTPTMAACVFRVDGVDVAVAGSSGPAPSASTFTQLAVQSGYGCGTPDTWQYGELIIVPRVTTSMEDADVGSYLQAKWGTA